jgi:hypothetical protein
MMLDATMRAPTSTAPALKKGGEDQAIGRSRGGPTTKIHAVVNALANPVALSLTHGQAADISQAEPLLEALEPGAVIANKGYDAYALVKTLEECNITPSSRQRPTASNSARVTSRSIESA